MGSTSLFKGFSQHSERTFKKLSTSSPKRLLVNIFKNVPEKMRKDKFVNVKLFKRVEMKGCCKDIEKDGTRAEDKMKAEMQCWYMCSAAPTRYNLMYARMGSELAAASLESELPVTAAGSMKTSLGPRKTIRTLGIIRKETEPG